MWLFRFLRKGYTQEGVCCRDWNVARRERDVGRGGRPPCGATVYFCRYSRRGCHHTGDLTNNPHVLAHIDQPPLSYWPPQRHAAQQRECNVPASLGNYQREKITHSVTSWCSRLRGVERWIVGFISERLLTAPVMSHGVHRSATFKAAHWDAQTLPGGVRTLGHDGLRMPAADCWWILGARSRLSQMTRMFAE